MSKRVTRQQPGQPTLSDRVGQYLTFDRLIIGGSILATFVIVAFIILGGSGSDPVVVVDQEILQDVQTFASLGGQHIAEGASHPAYNSNPPTSGWHYPNWATCRIYDPDQTPSDENLIHSLEHGAVWISYRDRDDSETIEQLEEIARRFSSHIAVTYRPENDAPIALVAWRNLLELDEVDEETILSFIQLFRQRGPEAAPC